MIEIINREKDILEVNTMSPLTWAYVGDAVYELFIRMNLVNTKKSKPHMLHIESIKYVKAEAQANILKRIYDELTEDEKDIVRRGRNAENHHLPKKFNGRRIQILNSIWSLNRILVLNQTRPKIRRNTKNVLLNID